MKHDGLGWEPEPDSKAQGRARRQMWLSFATAAILVLGAILFMRATTPAAEAEPVCVQLAREHLAAAEASNGTARQAEAQLAHEYLVMQNMDLKCTVPHA